MKKDVLNLTYYKGNDLYSDGEIEDELLDIVTNNEDYTKILRNDNRWAILYHLSPIRENLLEWYDFKKQASILEIGAGCGAITSLFCKKADKVVGIELSKKRSLINAARNAKYGNLEILVGNFEDIKLKEKFDYVSLIGVLEYSPLYINSEQPFEEILKRTLTYLNDDGKLIVAIENKMGLKYLAGATEDHTGKVFDGVENYEGVTNVRTFSKMEIEELFRKVGYLNLDFYYPVPDYKMPNVVFSQKYLPQKGDMRNVVDVFDRERYQTFNEELVFDQLCNDNMFEYFANSFLIFASR